MNLAAVRTDRRFPVFKPSLDTRLAIVADPEDSSALAVLDFMTLFAGIFDHRLKGLELGSRRPVTDERQRKADYEPTNDQDDDRCYQ